MSDSGNQVVLTKNEVVITDIKMPFGSMVVFMVKWAIAAIPAIIILAFLGAITMSFISGLTSSKVEKALDEEYIESLMKKYAD